MQFSITTPDLSIFTARLDQAPTIALASINTAIDKASKGVQLIARANAPKRTGKLAASITYNPLEGMKGIVYTRLNYAIFVHNGTGIYGPKHQRIVPVNKKVLAWKQDGKMIFAKSTKGMKANPFMSRAADSAMPVVSLAFSEASQSIINAIKGV